MFPARDHGIPSWFHHVDERFKSPWRTVWLAATLAFILGLPSLGSSVAFAAATSIATIGLYISYGTPILIGLLYPSNFKKGPFNLGVFSRPVALVACLWIGFITVIFCKLCAPEWKARCQSRCNCPESSLVRHFRSFC